MKKTTRLFPLFLLFSLLAIVLFCSSCTALRLERQTGFDQLLEHQGVKFHVTCANEGSLNRLKIVPSGLEIINSPIIREIEGTVTGAVAADINADGSPEIYVFVTSAGSGSYGILVALSSNNRKSLTDIYLAPFAENDPNGQGYMGHDLYSVVDDAVLRSFPVYNEGDSNAEPTGGRRHLRYKLVPGEAGWLLKLDGVSEL